jgi:glutathione reductase (NADPH)
MRLDVPGENYLTTSTEFLELDDLPQRILLLGGGYIAVEFAHIATRAGATVTIVEQGDRLLMPFDPDVVAWLTEKSRAIGIDVRTGTRVEAIEKDGAGYVVRADARGAKETYATDLVVHAAGRVPDLAPLELSSAGIESENGRLKLNEFLQSISNPAMYAAGDAASNGPPLTPVASHDAKVVAANLIDGNRHRPNYLGVPSVAFTIPPIASVGLSEMAARQQGLKFRVHSQKTSDWYAARRVGETAYGFKVLIEEQTDRVLGAHLIGPHVDEVINVFALAIRHGLTAADLKTTIFGYPTGASDVGYML